MGVAVARAQQVLHAQQLVEGGLVQQAHLQDDLAHIAPAARALAPHQVAVVVADDLVEVGDDADGGQHIAAAHLLIGLDPHDAQLAQRAHGVAQEPDRLEGHLADDRLHDVELELAGLGREGQRHVVADHLEADLVDDLRDDRVDLGGHDRRAGGPLGQADLPQARARPRGQQPQVVADLGELDGQALDGGVHRHVGAGVARGLQQVGGPPDVRQPGDLPQVAHHRLLVAGGRVEPGADGGGPQVDF